MNTPICDFIKKYLSKNPLRLHMPGHKGAALLGFEEYDITELQGADSLYEASGIIKESEDNASEIFGCRTFYSTEGSSHIIRAMLSLVCMYARSRGEAPLILAGRNAHKTFLSAAALLDFEVKWLIPSQEEGCLSCTVNADNLDKLLSESAQKPTAVFLTSPDYLGNIADVRSISEVCKKHGVLLAVDNAHGAYLKFLAPSLHPMDLGASICCDSAHKTLPVLTGGAYLHISSKAPKIFESEAKNSLSLFGSTSPSYLILQSLDMCNKYLDEGYREKLAIFTNKISALKERLGNLGFTLQGSDPLRITIATKPYGYKGTEVARILKKQNIFCEFCDPDYIVFMLTPENSENDLVSLEEALISLHPLEPIKDAYKPKFTPCRQVMSFRDAMLSPKEVIPTEKALGRVLGAPCVGCPPAVPVAVCGEVLKEENISALKYYNIDYCSVVK